MISPVRIPIGDRTWTLGASIAPLDMRTTIQPYGRPEMLPTNLATLQLARHYGVVGSAHTGLTDADRALDVWHELMAQPDLEPSINRDTEERLERVVQRANQRL